MVVLTGFIIGLCFALSVAWIVAESNDVQSIMGGQRWNLKGIGEVVIVEVLGIGKSFGGVGSNVNVKYRTTSGTMGYCNKWDIRKMGVLLHAPLQKEEKVEVILDWADHKRKTAPPANDKKKPYTDAEIIG